MGDQCHAGGNAGIAAVGGGDDDGIETQRHGKGGQGAYGFGLGHGNKAGYHEEQRGQKHETHGGYNVNALDAEHVAEFKLGNGHTRQKHGNGGHTVSCAGKGRAEKIGKLKARDTDDHTDQGAYEHGVAEILQAGEKAFLFAVGADEKHRRAPKVNTRPKGQGENDVLQENIGEERAYHGVAHKTEVGEYETVGINALFIGIAGAKRSQNIGDQNGKKEYPDAEQQKRAVLGQFLGSELLGKGSQNQSGNENVAFQAGKGGGGVIGNEFPSCQNKA